MQRAQVGLGQSSGQPDRGLAPGILQLGGDDQALSGQRVGGIEHRPAPAGQQEPRRIAGAAQAHPVGIGQRQQRARPGRGAGGIGPGGVQASALGADALDRAPVGIPGMPRGEAVRIGQRF